MATHSIAGCSINNTSHGAGAVCGLVLGYHDTATSTGKLLLYASSNGSSWDQASGGQISDLPVLNTWEHRALVRNGVNWHYYVNGTRTFTTSAGGSAALWTGGSKCSVGRAWYGGANAPGALGGNYDDFRITNGLERYSGASFTPPSTAHLTSAGDVNKQIIVNSAADGVAIGTGGINQARIAKAWVNFDGTGTIAIRESYNVSSLTDHATGDYTVTFSTAMTDANYVMAGSALNSTYSHSGDDSHRLPMPQKDGYLASSIRVFTKYGHSTGEGQEDENIVNVIVFGN